MSTNKLAYMKSLRTRMRDNATYSNNLRMAQYSNPEEEAQKSLGVRMPFKHTPELLATMSDLRMWTISYSPTKKNNLQRMQEMHRIQNEFLYMQSNTLGKRIIAGIILWFVVNKLAKKKFLNNGSKDSHDPCFRDTTATL